MRIGSGQPPARTGGKAIRTAAPTAALFACAAFFLMGCAFAPTLGIQNDEALFAAGIYEPTGMAYHRWIFGHKLPVMLMTYLGALKCWIYAAVFLLWSPSALSLRIPMVLAAAFTVWLFYLLLRRIASGRAAIIGCFLLATDTTFLLTGVFDWGPVVLQHLCLVGGVLLLSVYASKGRWPALAGAGLVFGLGAWDKALFFWLLGGVAVALAVVWPREILRLFTARRAALAACAFAIGALPLLLYNLNPHHRLVTFQSNTSLSAGDLPGKWHMARISLEGNALFGWLVREDHEAPHARPPRTALERASTWLSEASGRPRRNLLGYAFLFALPLGLLLWYRQGWKGEVRVMAAALVFLAVAWLQMALTQNAGGAVHHTVLLWPAPHLLIAVALGGASRHLPRGGAAAGALTAVLAASGLLVTNNYYAQIARNGGALNWTDAVHPLADLVRRTHARQVYVTDWGILDTLRLLGRGALPLVMASDVVSRAEPDDNTLAVLEGWLSAPGHLFIVHTEGNEFFPGSRTNLLQTAARLGYRSEKLATVADSHGVPFYELLRFVHRDAGFSPGASAPPVGGDALRFGRILPGRTRRPKHLSLHGVEGHHSALPVGLHAQ